MYNIEEVVKVAGGKDYIKFLIEEEGYGKDLMFNLLNIKSHSVYKKVLLYCNIEIPFSTVHGGPQRKWQIQWKKFAGKYWESEFLTNEILKKLENPVLNKAGSSERFVISMVGHPNANKDSHQVKAHQILWELNNKCYLPEGYEVGTIDGNYLNLTIDNLILRDISERKSKNASGKLNYFYVHGTPKYNTYDRGWGYKSKKYRELHNKCEICSSTKNLNAHHILSYHLFNKEDTRVHDDFNLLCVCDSCHAKIHQNNINIVPHISEMKYKKLLELLESLKSQVPDNLIEILRSVEKQLGLTDNQQPST